MANKLCITLIVGILVVFVSYNVINTNRTISISDYSLNGEFYTKFNYVGTEVFAFMSFKDNICYFDNVLYLDFDKTKVHFQGLKTDRIPIIKESGIFKFDDDRVEYIEKRGWFSYEKVRIEPIFTISTLNDKEVTAFEQIYYKRLKYTKVK